MICVVFCAVFASAGAFAAGQQQGAVAVKTAKATVVEETEPYVAVGRTVGSQEVKLIARVVGTLWERNGEEEERGAGREEGCNFLNVYDLKKQGKEQHET